MQILSNQLPSLTLHLKYQGAIKKQQEEKKSLFPWVTEAKQENPSPGFHLQVLS